jgi:hypothetical protein|tara:strand:+ start:954 stop:1139 length:186 start_codon:yes stop_codon:yes gene_type:complete
MSIKGEDIRQAKKFLENKKMSIKVIKPKLFAMASQKANKSFNDTLKVIARKYGEITNSNKK